MAVPLDSSVSFNKDLLAGDNVDITPASTSEAERKLRSSVLSKINVSKVRDLTPKKKFLFDSLRKERVALQRLQKKYEKKSLSLQELVDGLQGDSHKLVAALAKTMTPASAQLLASQVGRSKRSPNGFRWSTNEKLLALRIFKRSPKCYVLLRSIFTLPCPSTLINLLNRVPLCTGVNSVIFESLARSVSKYDVQDRVCCLMFDEMQIRKHLQYDSRLDRILGFEDLGGGAVQSRAVVANQALVFMAKGLRRKWKQPVGYFFNSGGANGQVLSILLKEVLRACRDAGLRVIATVCDMGSKNIAALKALGASYERPFFTFDNQEVVTIYDPPHLLKCARNMILDHDVLLNVKIGDDNPQVMTASWNHIQKAVILQKDEPYSTLHKVGGFHLKPHGFLKMKVSLAAQVMSNSMAATLHNMASEGTC